MLDNDCLMLQWEAWMCNFAIIIHMTIFPVCEDFSQEACCSLYTYMQQVAFQGSIMQSDFEGDEFNRQFPFDTQAMSVHETGENAYSAY